MTSRGLTEDGWCTPRLDDAGNFFEEGADRDRDGSGKSSHSPVIPWQGGKDSKRNNTLHRCSDDAPLNERCELEVPFCRQRDSWSLSLPSGPGEDGGRVDTEQKTSGCGLSTLRCEEEKGRRRISSHREHIWKFGGRNGFVAAGTHMFRPRAPGLGSRGVEGG